MTRILRRAAVAALVTLAGPAPVRAETVAITLTEVARHARRADCWIVIEGKVYDVTAYIDEHPAAPELLTDVCGRDASDGWRTKGTKSQPHSRKAAARLRAYLKGELAASGK